MSMRLIVLVLVTDEETGSEMTSDKPKHYPQSKKKSRDLKLSLFFIQVPQPALPRVTYPGEPKLEPRSFGPQLGVSFSA